MMDTETVSSTRRCARCGSPQGRWPSPNGFGGNYCCAGCATGKTCTCGAASTMSAAAKSPAATGIRDEESQLERMDDDLG